jgi:D-proline reductase (dithiol) PrdB
MAQISDLKLAYQPFMWAYPYRRVDWLPGARLQKPLAESRIAVVTTAGFHLPDQPRFDNRILGGDTSYRVIPGDTDLKTLRIAHRSNSFDASGIASDPNLALPLDRLKSLVEVAPRHFSFMGSIVAPGRLIANTAPEVARMLVEDAVDAVLLTPV